jgi:hypothetical protein
LPIDFFFSATTVFFSFIFLFPFTPVFNFDTPSLHPAGKYGVSLRTASRVKSYLALVICCALSASFASNNGTAQIELQSSALEWIGLVRKQETSSISHSLDRGDWTGAEPNRRKFQATLQRREQGERHFVDREL